jgi:hypothetical protein
MHLHCCWDHCSPTSVWWSVVQQRESASSTQEQLHVGRRSCCCSLASALPVAERSEAVASHNDELPLTAGAYQHPSLGTSSLPPRWRVPGLERASGSSGGSGDATLFRSVRCMRLTDDSCAMRCRSTVTSVADATFAFCPQRLPGGAMLHVRLLTDGVLPLALQR